LMLFFFKLFEKLLKGSSRRDCGLRSLLSRPQRGKPYGVWTDIPLWTRYAAVSTHHPIRVQPALLSGSMMATDITSLPVNAHGCSPFLHSAKLDK